MTDTFEFLSPAEVATILKVHVKTVHIWLRGGKMKGTKISYRTWRIPRSSLDEFLNSRSFHADEQKRARYAFGSEPLGTMEGSASLPPHSHGDLYIEPGHPPGVMKQYLKGIMDEK
jgi:excisionase family DNA binding protein